MDDYDPACPTEDETQLLLNLDLSQVPLPPSEPKQMVSTSKAERQDDPPLSQPDIDADRDGRGRRRKKKKKKAQSRVRSVAEASDEEEEQEAEVKLEEHDISSAIESDAKREMNWNFLKSAEKITSGGEDDHLAAPLATRLLPQRAPTTSSPTPAAPSPHREDKPAGKLSFKLGGGTVAAKSKVSFQFKRNLRGSTLPMNDEEEEEDSNPAGEEDKNIERTAAGEYVPTRFKVSKKHEMFRPSQGGPQSLTVVFDSSSIGGSALSYSQTNVNVSNVVFSNAVPTGDIEQVSKPIFHSDQLDNNAPRVEKLNDESKKEDNLAGKEEEKDKVSMCQSRQGKEESKESSSDSKLNTDSQSGTDNKREGRDLGKGKHEDHDREDFIHKGLGRAKEIAEGNRKHRKDKRNEREDTDEDRRYSRRVRERKEEIKDEPQDDEKRAREHKRRDEGKYDDKKVVDTSRDRRRHRGGKRGQKDESMDEQERDEYGGRDHKRRVEERDQSRERGRDKEKKGDRKEGEMKEEKEGRYQEKRNKERVKKNEDARGVRDKKDDTRKKEENEENERERTMKIEKDQYKTEDRRNRKGYKDDDNDSRERESKNKDRERTSDRQEDSNMHSKDDKKSKGEKEKDKTMQDKNERERREDSKRNEHVTEEESANGEKENVRGQYITNRPDTYNEAIKDSNQSRRPSKKEDCEDNRSNARQPEIQRVKDLQRKYGEIEVDNENEYTPTEKEKDIINKDEETEINDNKDSETICAPLSPQMSFGLSKSPKNVEKVKKSLYDNVKTDSESDAAIYQDLKSQHGRGAGKDCVENEAKVSFTKSSMLNTATDRDLNIFIKASNSETTEAHASEIEEKRDQNESGRSNILRKSMKHRRERRGQGRDYSSSSSSSSTSSTSSSSDSESNSSDTSKTKKDYSRQSRLSSDHWTERKKKSPDRRKEQERYLLTRPERGSNQAVRKSSRFSTVEEKRERCSEESSSLKSHSSPHKDSQAEEVLPEVVLVDVSALPGKSKWEMDEEEEEEEQEMKQIPSYKSNQMISFGITSVGGSSIKPLNRGKMSQASYIPRHTTYHLSAVAGNPDLPQKSLVDSYDDDSPTERKKDSSEKSKKEETSTSGKKRHKERKQKKDKSEKKSKTKKKLEDEKKSIQVSKDIESEKDKSENLIAEEDLRSQKHGKLENVSNDGVQKDIESTTKVLPLKKGMHHAQINDRAISSALLEESSHKQVAKSKSWDFEEDNISLKDKRRKGKSESGKNRDKREKSLSPITKRKYSQDQRERSQSPNNKRDSIDRSPSLLKETKDSTRLPAVEKDDRSPVLLKNRKESPTSAKGRKDKSLSPVKDEKDRSAFTKSRKSKSPSPAKSRKDRSPLPNKAIEERSPSPRKIRKDRSPSPIKIRKDESSSPAKTRKDKSPSPGKLRESRADSPAKASKSDSFSPPKDRSLSPTTRSKDRSMSPTIAKDDKSSLKNRIGSRKVKKDISPFSGMKKSRSPSPAHATEDERSQPSDRKRKDGSPPSPKLIEKIRYASSGEKSRSPSLVEDKQVSSPALKKSRKSESPSIEKAKDNRSPSIAKGKGATKERTSKSTRNSESKEGSSSHDRTLTSSKRSLSKDRPSSRSKRSHSKDNFSRTKRSRSKERPSYRTKRSGSRDRREGSRGSWTKHREKSGRDRSRSRSYSRSNKSRSPDVRQGNRKSRSRSPKQSDRGNSSRSSSTGRYRRDHSRSRSSDRWRFSSSRRRGRSPITDKYGKMSRGHSRSRSESIESQSGQQTKTSLVDNKGPTSGHRKRIASPEKDYKSVEMHSSTNKQTSSEKEVSVGEIPDIDSIPMPGEMLPEQTETTKAEIRKEAGKSESDALVDKEGSKDIIAEEPMEISDEEAKDEDNQEESLGVTVVMQEHFKDDVEDEKTNLKQEVKTGTKGKSRAAQPLGKERQIKFSIAGGSKKLRPVKLVSGALVDEDEEDKVSQRKKASTDRLRAKSPERAIDSEKQDESVEVKSEGKIDLIRENLAKPDFLSKGAVQEEIKTDRESSVALNNQDMQPDKGTGEDVANKSSSIKPEPKRHKFTYVPLWEMEEREKRPVIKLESPPQNPSGLGLALDYGSGSSDFEDESSPVKRNSPFKGQEAVVQSRNKLTGANDGTSLPPFSEKLKKLDKNIADVSQGFPEKTSLESQVCSVVHSSVTRFAQPQESGSKEVQTDNSEISQLYEEVYSPSHPSLEEVDDLETPTNISQVGSSEKIPQKQGLSTGSLLSSDSSKRIPEKIGSVVQNLSASDTIVFPPANEALNSVTAMQFQRQIPLTLPVPTILPITIQGSGLVPASVQSPGLEPVPALASGSTPIPEPAPVPVPAPVCPPGPVPAPVHVPGSMPVLVQAPGLVPAPVKVQEPMPAAFHVQGPLHALASGSTPTPEQVPGPVPVPVLPPGSVPAPVQASRSVLISVQAPVPAPVCPPGPMPAPVHVPGPVPMPVQAFERMPAPSLAPASIQTPKLISAPAPTSGLISAYAHISVPLPLHTSTHEQGPVPAPVVAPATNTPAISFPLFGPTGTAASSKSSKSTLPVSTQAADISVTTGSLKIPTDTSDSLKFRMNRFDEAAKTSKIAQESAAPVKSPLGSVVSSSSGALKERRKPGLSKRPRFSSILSQPKVEDESVNMKEARPTFTPIPLSISSADLKPNDSMHYNFQTTGHREVDPTRDGTSKMISQDPIHLQPQSSNELSNSEPETIIADSGSSKSDVSGFVIGTSNMTSESPCTSNKNLKELVESAKQSELLEKISDAKREAVDLKEASTGLVSSEEINMSDLDMSSIPLPDDPCSSVDRYESIHKMESAPTQAPVPQSSSETIFKDVPPPLPSSPPPQPPLPPQPPAQPDSSSSPSGTTTKGQTLGSLLAERKKRFSQSPLAIGLLPKVPLPQQSPLSIGPLPKLPPEPESVTQVSSMKQKSSTGSSKIQMVIKSKTPIQRKLAAGFDDDGSDGSSTPGQVELASETDSSSLMTAFANEDMEDTPPPPPPPLPPSAALGSELEPSSESSKTIDETKTLDVGVEKDSFVQKPKAKVVSLTDIEAFPVQVITSSRKEENTAAATWPEFTQGKSSKKDEDHDDHRKSKEKERHRDKDKDEKRRSKEREKADDRQRRPDEITEKRRSRQEDSDGEKRQRDKRRRKEPSSGSSNKAEAIIFDDGKRKIKTEKDDDGDYGDKRYSKSKSSRSGRDDSKRRSQNDSRDDDDYHNRRKDRDFRGGDHRNTSYRSSRDDSGSFRQRAGDGDRRKKRYEDEADRNRRNKQVKSREGDTHRRSGGTKGRGRSHSPAYRRDKYKRGRSSSSSGSSSSSNSSSSRSPIKDRDRKGRTAVDRKKDSRRQYKEPVHVEELASASSVTHAGDVFPVAAVVSSVGSESMPSFSEEYRPEMAYGSVPNYPPTTSEPSFYPTHQAPPAPDNSFPAQSHLYPGGQYAPNELYDSSQHQQFGNSYWPEQPSSDLYTQGQQQQTISQAPLSAQQQHPSEMSGQYHPMPQELPPHQPMGTEQYLYQQSHTYPGQDLMYHGGQVPPVHQHQQQYLPGLTNPPPSCMPDQNSTQYPITQPPTFPVDPANTYFQTTQYFPQESHQPNVVQDTQVNQRSNLVSVKASAILHQSSQLRASKTFGSPHFPKPPTDPKSSPTLSGSPVLKPLIKSTTPTGKVSIRGSPLSRTAVSSSAHRNSPTTTSSSTPTSSSSELSQKRTILDEPGFGFDITTTKEAREVEKGIKSSERTKEQTKAAEVNEPIVSSSSVEETAHDALDVSRTESGSLKPLKVKSRWRRTSEAEAMGTDPSSSGRPDCSSPRLIHQTSASDSQSREGRRTRSREAASQESSQDDSEDLDAKIPALSQPVSKKPKLDSRAGDLIENDAEASNADEAGYGKDFDYQDLQSIVKRDDFPKFEIITENIHLTERKKSKSMKRMQCDCTTSREDRVMGIEACGSDCLNRMLMIECGTRCPCGEHCTNRRFQRKHYSNALPFKAGEKGWGLRAMEDMNESGTFIMEYVGELLDYEEFVRRTKQYSKEGTRHHYFMALNADEVIDATLKGSISRFINHSCDPNCETQKWTVNGELRVGFFTRKEVKKGEELTFDYQFEHYGEAQKCYCGAENCRGYIGLVKPSQTKQTNKKEKKKKKDIFKDELLEEDIEKLSMLDGMRNKNHVLELCRLMVRAEKVQHRIAILKIMQDTSEMACLRLFLDYHGLPLFWSWMADIGSADYSDDTQELKMLMLSVLKCLPINNKTVLKESKILDVVQRWAVAAVAAARKPPPPPPPTSTTLPTALPIQSTSSVSTDIVEPESSPAAFADISDGALSADTEEVPMSEMDVTEPSTSSSDVSPPSPQGSPSEPQFILPGSNITPVSILASATKASGDRGKRRVTFAEEHEESQFSPDPYDSSEESNGISSSTQYSEEGEGAYLRARDKTLDIPGEAAASEDQTLDRESDPGLGFRQEATSSSVADSTSQREMGEYEGEGGTGSDNDASDTECAIKDPLASLAAECMSQWSHLKEIFKIPKKERVEERKRTERELDVLSKKDTQASDPFAKWKSNPMMRFSKRKFSDDEEKKPSAPKMSKEQRRQLFEAQVKAEDEKVAQAAAEELQRQQETFMLHQQRMLEDPTYCYYHHQMQAAGIQVSIDPTLVLPESMLDPETGLPILSHEVVLDPATGQPIIDPTTGQPMLAPVQQQHILDPNTGQPMVDLTTGQPLTQDILLDPSTCQPLIDPNTGQAMLASTMQQQQQQQQPMMLDPATGQPVVAHPGQDVLDSNTGQTMMTQLDPTIGQSILDPSTGQPMQQLQLDSATGQPIDPMTGQFLPHPQLQGQQVDPQTGQPVQFVEAQMEPHVGQPIAPAPEQMLEPMYNVQPPLLLQLSEPFLAQISSIPEQDMMEEEVPPPPSPPTAPVSKLPPNWKTAKDAEGRIYYYHAFTRQTQWDLPSWEENDEDSDDMDLSGLQPEEYIKHQSSKRKATTAAADTSSEVARKIKDHFRSKMSGFIVVCLNPYRKNECKMGRITSTEDFKHLARKLTHHVMSKELKHCKHVEDLEVNENVKAKAKDYVRKYMSKFGAIYKTTASPDSGF